MNFLKNYIFGLKSILLITNKKNCSLHTIMKFIDQVIKIHKDKKFDVFTFVIFKAIEIKT